MSPKCAIVLYLPSLHRGYIDFFKKYPGNLYILGEGCIKDFPRMDRDIRALTSEEAKKAVESLNIFTNIEILTHENIKKLTSEENKIIAPDDEISRSFTEKNLKGRDVEFVPVFLRWDRTISTKENEISPDRIISEDEFDKNIMTQAFNEAGKSPDWWRQVGAVLLKNKTPILAMHNTPLPSEYSLNTFGDPRSNFDADEKKYKNLSKCIHAEASVIAQAAQQGITTEGASLYVTTFPCPACARSIAVAGIKEVYYSQGYSLLDAEDILKSFGIKIVLVKK